MFFNFPDTIRDGLKKTQMILRNTGASGIMNAARDRLPLNRSLETTLSGNPVEPTQFGTIHYGKNGAHIVPANPNQY